MTGDSDNTPDDSPVDSPAPASSETELSSVFVEDTSYTRTSPSPTPSSASSLLLATKEDHQKTVNRDVTEVEVGVAATDAANVVVNENNGVISGNSSLTDMATGATYPTIAGDTISEDSSSTHTGMAIGSSDVENGGVVKGTSDAENEKMVEGTSTTSGERDSMGEESSGGGDMVKSFNPL